MMSACAGCRKYRSIYKDKLCRGCYGDPTQDDAEDDLDSDLDRSEAHWIPVDPLGPTRELPGTEGKVKVMENRARRRVQVFHPNDARRSHKVGTQYRPEPGDIWQHFMGGRYEVVRVEQREDDGVAQVVYRSPAGEEWTRSLEDFMGEVKVKDRKVPRFVLVLAAVKDVPAPPRCEPVYEDDEEVLA